MFQQTSTKTVGRSRVPARIHRHGIAAGALFLSLAVTMGAAAADPARRSRPADLVIVPALRIPLPPLSRGAPRELAAAYDLAADWAHFDHQQAVHWMRLRAVKKLRSAGKEPVVPDNDWLHAHLVRARTVNETVLATLARVERIRGVELIDVYYLRAEILRRQVEYEFMRAALEWDEALAAGERDSPALDLLDSPRYGQAIALWERLVRDHPEHPNVPYTLYQLAYYRYQDGDYEAARHALATLLCQDRHQANPPPYATCEPLLDQKRARADRRVSDRQMLIYAWMLLGDIHFETAGEQALAALAYERAARGMYLPIQVAALYKQAWSFYRMDDYPRAIAAFDQVLVLASGAGNRTARAAEIASTARLMRPEAVQYMAIAFVDSWQLDSQNGVVSPSPTERAVAHFGARAHTVDARDVLAATGDILADMQALPQATEARQRANSIRVDQDGDTDPDN